MQIQTNTYQIIPNTCQILANPYPLTLRILPPFVFRIGMYLHVFGMYWHVLACIGLYTTNTIQTNTEHLKKNIGIVLVCICMYWYVWCVLYVMVCMRLYWYVLLCIDIYWTQSFVFIGGLHQNSIQVFGWSEGVCILQTHTNQYWPMEEFMCDWICLYWYVCTCIVLYCCVLTCIDPYGLYLLVVYLLLYLLVIHMVCIYYTCINIPVYDNLNEYIPILSILPRLVCMCVTVCVSCCILAFLCTSVNNVRIK